MELHNVIKLYVPPNELIIELQARNFTTAIVSCCCTQYSTGQEVITSEFTREVYYLAN